MRLVSVSCRLVAAGAAISLVLSGCGGWPGGDRGTAPPTTADCPTVTQGGADLWLIAGRVCRISVSGLAKQPLTVVEPKDAKAGAAGVSLYGCPTLLQEGVWQLNGGAAYCFLELEQSPRVYAGLLGHTGTADDLSKRPDVFVRLMGATWEIYFPSLVIQGTALRAMIWAPTGDGTVKGWQVESDGKLSEGKAIEMAGEPGRSVQLVVDAAKHYRQAVPTM